MLIDLVIARKEVSKILEINKIYNQDCLIGMNEINDQTIDMILCDLPYGTTKNQWDSIIPLDKLWIQYERIIKDDGAIILTSSQPFTTKLNSSNLQLFRYEMIWVKNNVTGFQLANIRPLKKHEVISVFFKKQPKYNPQGLINFNKINRRGSTGDNWSELEKNEYIQEFTNYPNSILHYEADRATFHPTQKPVKLFEYLIKTYTEKGDLILDNCMGSGTTAVAAINTDRNFIGFELNKEYFDLAVKRVEQNTTQLDLFEVN